MPARHKYRVLYLDTAPTVGGSVISLYQLLRKLDRTRYDPVVVAYAPHAYIQEFRALGADVIEWDVYASQSTLIHRSTWASGAKESAPARWLRSAAWGSRLYHTLGFVALLLRSVWPRARALRRLIAEKHIDLVHTNIRVGHDREGIIAARMAGVPCVCHVRHHERLNVYDRRLAEAVDALIYISEAVQRSHLEAGVDRQTGRVVYNGLEISEFDHAIDAERDGRDFALSGDDLAVGIVGRLERWKGHEVFLRAMAEVVKTVPEARGVAVGDMVPHDPDYRSELLALRDELGLADRVFFSGFRPDISAVMSALDVLVLASTRPEPFGRVLIEAMAAGKPVVATDAGAAREIMEDGVQGVLVPPGDVTSLAHAIERILTCPDLAVAMGQKGRARVRERFTVQQYVDGVQAVYRDVLGSREREA